MPKTLLSLCVFIVFGIYSTAQNKIDSLKTVLEKTTDKVTQLDVLDSLTKELVRNNSQDQVKYLNDYINLARDLEEYDAMASKSRFLIQYYAYNGKNVFAQKLCDSFLSYKPKFKKESSEAHLLLKRAGTYFSQERFDRANLDYKQSADLFLKSGDSIFAADAFYFNAQAYSDKSDFINALNNYKKAVNLYEILGDNQYVLLVGSEISILYTKNGLIEKSIKENQRLTEKARDSKDFIALSQIVGLNIMDYYKLGDFENMEKALVELKNIIPKIDNIYVKEYQELVYVDYKLIYECEKNNITEANKLMAQLLEKSKNGDLVKHLETNLLAAKAKYYETVNNQKALIPILETLASIKTTDRINAQVRARDKLAKIYEDQGNLQEAIALKNRNTKIKDSIYNAQKTNTFLYYQAEFEAEQKQNELLKQDAQIKQLETEQELANTKRNGLIAGIVAFFIIAIAYFYIRNKQKIKEQAYQNILLNNKVASKTEEINELLNETMRHIKSKERIAENLQKLSNEKEGITLKSIIADLKASKADNAKLMLIKQNIEQVNFEFIKTLKTLHPELSKTDIEICSLIRIGLSRKEVANLRNTSLEAVKTSRFRLKKKLNLTAEQSLDDYINTL